MAGGFTLEILMSSLIVLVYLFVTSYAILLSKKVGSFKLAKAWVMFSCAGILLGIYNVLEFLKHVKLSLISTEATVTNGSTLSYQISSQLIQMLAAACLVLAVWFLANSFISREEER